MEQKERLRLEKMSVYEKALHLKGFRHIAGVDEVGRGPLAGPVVAAACILPQNYRLQSLNDSKKLTDQQRQKISVTLKQDPAVHFAIAFIDAKTIDQINIFQASHRAMIQAILNLKQKPDFLLIDGKYAPDVYMPRECIIKGDSKSLSIAAASILAKVARDEWMVEFSKTYPLYGFEEHMGYATPQHLEAIKKYGPCPLHRMSFEPIKSRNQLTLF